MFPFLSFLIDNILAAVDICQLDSTTLFTIAHGFISLFQNLNRRMSNTISYVFANGFEPKIFFRRAIDIIDLRKENHYGDILH
jgi:hypothetical protein